MACEIIPSSPETGGRGTLYFHFPFPVSNGLAAARRTKGGGPGGKRGLLRLQASQLRGSDSVRDLRGEIEDPKSLHVAILSGTGLQLA